MDREIIKFDDTEIVEYKFHQHKSPISINDIDINKIVVPNNKIEIYSTEDNSEEIYFDDSYNEDSGGENSDDSDDSGEEIFEEIYSGYSNNEDSDGKFR